MAEKKQINLTIDDIKVAVPEGTTVMEAAERIGVHIPRLCYHPDLSLAGSCRVCIVDVKGMGFFMASCSVAVWEGMEVQTNSPEIRQARRDIVELLLDNHPTDCQTCERDGNCELQNLAYAMGVRERLFEGQRKRFPIDDSSHSVVRNPEKCILCGRCVRVCAEIQGVYNLSQHGRGFHTVVGPAHLANMDESVCIQCGQCINVCPTAAFLEKSATEDVWKAIADPKKHVVVQTAAVDPRRHRRGLRTAAGHAHHRQDGHGAARVGVQRRVRHRLRRRPDDRRGGARVPHPAPGNGRPAADDHLLLAGMDQLPGEVLSGDDPARLDVPVADEHALHAYQDLLRQEDGTSTRPRSTWSRSCRAWRRSTRRGRPEHLMARRHALHRRRADHAGTDLDDQVLRDHHNHAPRRPVRRPAGPGQRRGRHLRRPPAA